MSQDWPSTNLYGRPVLGSFFMYGFKTEHMQTKATAGRLITFIGASKMKPVDLGILAPFPVGGALQHFPKNAGCLLRMNPATSIAVGRHMDPKRRTFVSITIPNVAALLGLKFYTQSVGICGYVPSRAFVTSVGEGVIGRQ